MKQIGRLNAAMLGLLLMATAASGYAQHDDKNKGQDKQDHQALPSGAQRPQQQQHAQNSPQQNRGQEQRTQPRQAAPARQVEAQRPQEQPRVQPQQRMQPVQQQNNWQQHRARNFASQHQTWAQRGGYQGYRVPDPNFNKSFGRNHSFHVFGLPYMEVGGLPRFQYGGYWFSMMEPYPEYWGSDWYRNDDMYVDYDGGGYYLYDRRYANRPGVAISILF